MAKKKKSAGSNVAAENRKARFNYEILDTLEAGLVLTGTEVKSLREGRASIAESYASEEGGELWLINSNLPEYLQANRFNHVPKRRRKILVHRTQLSRLASAIQKDGWRSSGISAAARCRCASTSTNAAWPSCSWRWRAARTRPTSGRP